MHIFYWVEMCSKNKLPSIAAELLPTLPVNSNALKREICINVIAQSKSASVFSDH